MAIRALIVFQEDWHFVVSCRVSSLSPSSLSSLPGSAAAAGAISSSDGAQTYWRESARKLLNGGAIWEVRKAQPSSSSLSLSSSSSSSSFSSQSLGAPRQPRPSQRLKDYDTADSPYAFPRSPFSSCLDGGGGGRSTRRNREEEQGRRVLTAFLESAGLQCIRADLLDEKFTLAIIQGPVSCSSCLLYVSGVQVASCGGSLACCLFVTE